MLNDTYRHKGMRRKLLELLRSKGISDETVLDAIDKVPRHLFLDNVFVNFAYKNQAFPIGSEQTISHPFTVAFQTQLLELRKSEKVLEIGTGSGYQCSVLMEMSVKVFSIERHRSLHMKSKKILNQLGYFPKLFFGDGYKGLPGYAPYDKIIITAAAPFIPQDLLEQLKVGGMMVIPLGDTDKQEMQRIIKIAENEFKTETYGEFSFVPMLQDKSFNS